MQASCCNKFFKIAFLDLITAKDFGQKFAWKHPPRTTIKSTTPETEVDLNLKALI
jgi:hypothetical protein